MLICQQALMNIDFSVTV